MNAVRIDDDQQSAVQSRRILLAEDEVLIRMDVADSLREDGWEVVEVGTALEAIEVLKSCVFDAVLTDVHMPGGMTGLDLARTVRAEHPGVVVVIMSGLHRPAESEAYLFDAFLPKPVMDVPRVIHRLVSRSES